MTLIPAARDVHIARYREWLDCQGFRFGFGDEIADYSNRANGSVLNQPPPVTIWHHIEPTVRLLEKVREQFGVTVVLSAYRSPAYNSLVAGAADSMHTHNKAIDFKCATGKPKDWASYLRSVRNTEKFRGGVGVYDTFVHVDTRGYNADWTG